MNILRFLFKQSRGIFAIAVLTGVISGGAGAALLGIINKSLARQGGSLTMFVWAFVGLCIAVTLARVVSHVLLVRLGENSVLEIRLDLIRRILGTPLARLEEIGPHRLLAALTDDTTYIANALTLLPALGISLLMVVSSLGYLGWLSLRVLGIFLIVMVAAGFSYGLPLRRLMHLYRQARAAQDGMYKQFRVLTDGSKELKLHAPRRQAFVQILERIATDLRDRYIQGAKLSGMGTAWGQMMVFLIVGFLVFVLPHFEPVPRETLTGYTLVVFYIMYPFQHLLQSIPQLSRGSVALDRVEKLGLSLEPGPGLLASPVASLGWQRLELSGVIYGYHQSVDGEFVVGPIDLSFQPGEVVFLVGGNGSGKTTLAKIISGLYTPEQGEIRIDGRRVTPEGLDAYRQLFSTVFSDFCLFGTLLGLEGPGLDQRAHGYLAQLQLERKVSVKDGEFSTLDLSQGQRKRLALLTAYLEDRPIYIFDEWAADQDPTFKQIFYHQLLPELKARGKTVLVISHDDRYFAVGDRIVKLEEGRLVSCEEVSRV